MQVSAASFSQEQQAKAVKSAEQGCMVQPSLLKALYKAYGLPYLLLGIIKLINDILGFAGPILLNLLIRYLETPPREAHAAALSSSAGTEWRRHWLPQPDSLAFGLLCAALLGVTSLVKVGVLMVDHQPVFQNLQISSFCYKTPCDTVTRHDKTSSARA